MKDCEVGSRSNDLYSTTNGNSEEKIQIVKVKDQSIETLPDEDL